MIRIILGDITEINDVDVLINSAKKSLMGGGGVDGAIHHKAGSDLLRACKELHGCEVGEAKITKGFNLSVPYIIHTVGPVHYDDFWAKKHNYDQVGMLKSAYSNSLKLAKEHNLKRVAFSAIATGAYMYPIDEATKIALDTVIEFMGVNPEFEVTFVLFTEDHYGEYVKQIKDYNVEFSTTKYEIDYYSMDSMKDSVNHYRTMTKSEPIKSLKDNMNSYNSMSKSELVEDEVPVEVTKKENAFKRILKKLKLI
jgi:Predicted phosphatase homologous to the C-terminal domain of histone macroH2A1